MRPRRCRCIHHGERLGVAAEIEIVEIGVAAEEQASDAAAFDVANELQVGLLSHFAVLAERDGRHSDD
jgi:hypothetical protein